jgi:hypothetical protein
VATGLLVIAITVAGLGLINGALFNQALSRRGFDTEPLSETLLWGEKSLVGPALLCLLMFLTAWAALTAVKLASLWQPVAWLITRVKRWSLHVGLEDVWQTPATLSQIAAVLGALSISLICFRYREMLKAWVSYIDTAPAAVFTVLANSEKQAHFRFEMSSVIIVVGICLVRIARLRLRERSEHGRVSLYACIAVFMVAILMNDAPYRLIHDHNKERVALNGQRCYVIGDNNGRLLLFCPDINPPRNRIVEPYDPSLERLGVRESMFTPTSAP